MQLYENFKDNKHIHDENDHMVFYWWYDYNFDDQMMIVITFNMLMIRVKSNTKANWNSFTREFWISHASEKGGGEYEKDYQKNVTREKVMMMRDVERIVGIKRQFILPSRVPGGK